jgi:hypothetical protein
MSPARNHVPASLDFAFFRMGQIEVDRALLKPTAVGKHEQILQLIVPEGLQPFMEMFEFEGGSHPIARASGVYSGSGVRMKIVFKIVGHGFPPPRSFPRLPDHETGDSSAEKTMQQTLDYTRSTRYLIAA